MSKFVLPSTSKFPLRSAAPATVNVPSTFKLESISAFPVTSRVPGISTLLVNSTSVPLAAVCKICLAEPLANLLTAISALLFISAFTIVPSTISSLLINDVDVASPPKILPSSSKALFLASCAVKLDSVDELLRSVALMVLPLAKFVYELSASLVLRSIETTAPLGRAVLNVIVLLSVESV